MTNSYRIVVASLPDYKYLVAEIYIDDVFVGLLSQEGGEEHTRLEFAPARASHPIALSLSAFEEGLASAKERLRQLGEPRPTEEGTDDHT